MGARPGTFSMIALTAVPATPMMPICMAEDSVSVIFSISISPVESYAHAVVSVAVDCSSR